MALKVAENYVHVPYNTISGHMWTVKGRSFRNHAPSGRGKTGSFSKHTMYGQEKERIWETTPHEGGKRKEVTETMPHTGVG